MSCRVRRAGHGCALRIVLDVMREPMFGLLIGAGVIYLVLIVFMMIGAWCILRARVLTRRAAAIETLGAATSCAVTGRARSRKTT